MLLESLNQYQKTRGYYKVGNLGFESKIDACLVGTIKNLHPTWHFNDEVFNTINWQDEPAGSLYDWYGARAKQIREQYDYICLMYSGGSDSQTMLEAFLDNNLFIDEIVTTSVNLNFTQSNIDKIDWTNYTNQDLEPQLVAFPVLDKIKYISPKTKINYKDMADDTLSYFQSSKSDSFIEDCSEWLHPQGVMRWNPIIWNNESNKEMRASLDRGKKIAILYGVDKPRFYYNQGKMYAYFIDTICNARKGTVKSEYPNLEHVFFYWSPDMPEVIVKQCHAIFQWFKNNPKYIRYVDGHQKIQKYQQKLDEFYKMLTYPRYMQKKIFQTRKHPGAVSSKMYYAFDEPFKKMKEYYKWKGFVENIHKSIDKKYFKYSEDGEWMGFVGFVSPFYLVGDITHNL